MCRLTHSLSGMQRVTVTVTVVVCLASHWEWVGPLHSVLDDEIEIHAQLCLHVVLLCASFVNYVLIH